MAKMKNSLQSDWEEVILSHITVEDAKNALKRWDEYPLEYLVKEKAEELNAPEEIIRKVPWTLANRIPV